MTTTESTLTLTYEQLRREIGRELGWPRDPASWSSDQVTDAADMIGSGCRMAYYPPNWQWTFLKPRFTITTVSGIREYDLPPDFAALVGGQLTFNQDDDAWHGVTIVSDQALRARYMDQLSVVTGYPIEACVRFSRPTDEQSMRAVLDIWPTPDAAYHLSGQCIVQPNTITSDQGYAYGDAAFHEVLLNAILHQCELKLGEMQGRYFQQFTQALASCQRLDTQRFPDNLGYNGDGSDRRGWRRRDVRPGTVTYTG